LVRIASDVNRAEHYGALIDSVIYDADGAYPSPVYWLQAFAKRELLAGKKLSYGAGWVSSKEIPNKPKVSEEVAKLIEAALGRRNPYAEAQEQHLMPNPSAPRVSGYEGMRVQYDLAKGDLTQFGEMPTPERVYEFAKSHDMLDDVRERLYALYVNNQNKPMGYRLIGAGSRTGTVVDMPVVFGPATALHARGIVLVHNHPGAKRAFSLDDIAITERMVATGRILGIQVLDHILATRDGWMSLLSVRQDIFTAHS